MRFRFALAALLLPLGIRAIPEILVGPYQVGWDTIAFYVPNTLDWAAGKVGVFQMLGTAPLMYMITVPVYMLTQVNPVWIFKIMGPVLYGSMMLALFRFLRLGLKWIDRQSLGAVLLASLYFVTLRVSWDMYRNMLGLTFILLALPLLGRPKARSKWLLPGLVVLSILSDQLTGVIILSILGIRALVKIRQHDSQEFFRTLMPAIAGGIAFLAIVASALGESMMTLVQTQPPVPTANALDTSLGFMTFAYLPLAPFALVGLRSARNFELYAWSFCSLGLATTALLPFAGIHVLSYRWTLLLDIPVVVFSASGLINLSSIIHQRFQGPWSLHLSRLVLPGLFLTLSILYIALPAQQAFEYYVSYPALFPTSMSQDTVPASDMSSLKQLIDWTYLHINSDVALITHWAIYGWARAYFPNERSIINYGFSSPVIGLELAHAQGFSSVLVIWWVDGAGWHGQPTVPNVFVQLLRIGDMAVYKASATRTSVP